MNPEPIIYTIEPIVWIVGSIVSILVCSCVALWIYDVHGPGGDREYGEWSIQDTEDAHATRERISTMRERIHLDGSADRPEAMRKNTL